MATYSLTKEQAARGRTARAGAVPRAREAAALAGKLPVRGEQQMLVLAQALVTAPRFICIDELSLGLAPVVVRRLIPVIREIADSGTGVLLIEQFATIALGLANRAYVIEGRPACSTRATPPSCARSRTCSHSAYLLRGTDGPRTRRHRELSE